MRMRNKSSDDLWGTSGKGRVDPFDDEDENLSESLFKRKIFNPVFKMVKRVFTQGLTPELMALSLAFG